MWAAISYRRAQALVLVLLAALVTACAVFAPLYERALEQALLRNLLDTAHPADTALTVRAGRTAAFPELGVGDLEAAVREPLRSLHDEGIGMVYGRMRVTPRAGLQASPGELVARTGVCEHLRITRGKCPRGAGEVLVSAKDVQAWGWRVGQRFTTPIDGAAPTAVPPVLTVAGAYEVVSDENYWLRTQIDGKSGTTISRGLDIVPALDTWVTPESTFTREWSNAQLTLTSPLLRERVTLESLPALSAALGAGGGGSPASAAQTAARGAGNAQVDSPLPALTERLRGGQEQVRVIVPLLMAQLGLLGAAVLLLVAQASVEQRRPEVALARLRGHSRDRAGRLVMGELALTVAAGLPLGVVLAVALSEGVRRAALPAGVPFEMPPMTYAALGASALVCAVAIWAAARPLRRESISTLLRRLSPTARPGWAVADILAVALAVFGVVGLATRSLEGPLALATPTLVAVAAGLVASRLAATVAGAVGRARVRRGRVGPALTALALQRRPSLRKVVTVVGVATALTVFAANAMFVADRNREARAQLEVGAPAVLVTDSRQPAQFADAVAGLDPTGQAATPVAVVRPRDPNAPSTLAVMPDGLAAVGYPLPDGERLRLPGLAAPGTEPLVLRDGTVTGRVSWTFHDLGSRTPAHAVPGQSGRPVDGGAPLPEQTPAELRLAVTMPDGQQLSRTLALVPMTVSGSRAISAPLLCPSGCRLDAFEFRLTDAATSAVEGTLRLAGLTVDGTPLPLAEPERWLPFSAQTDGGEDYLRVRDGTSGDTLALALRNTGRVGRLAHADVPAVVPGVLAGDLPPGGTASAFPANGLGGAQLSVFAAQRVKALPEVGARGVLVNYETLARLGGVLPDRARLSVWLADPSPESRQRVAESLAAQGINVVAQRTYAQAKRGYDESASGWGLRLAAFAGVAALLMAGLVLVVIAVTSWRVVARDLAALHLSGVPLAILRRALLGEQLALVLVGAAVGVLCGALTSALAMPLLPLFDVPAEVPALQLEPSWQAIALAALASTTALVAIGAGVAVAVGRKVALRRVREAL
jgi:putative ABC transport system permease protein